MTEWRPIESAPKDGTRILAYLGADYIEIAYWRESPTQSCWWIDAHAPPQWTWDIKAWMPLPAPPEDVK